MIELCTTSVNNNNLIRYHVGPLIFCVWIPYRIGLFFVWLSYQLQKDLLPIEIAEDLGYLQQLELHKNVLFMRFILILRIIYFLLYYKTLIFLSFIFGGEWKFFSHHRYIIISYNIYGKCIRCLNQFIIVIFFIVGAMTNEKCNSYKFLKTSLLEQTCFNIFYWNVSRSLWMF